MLDLAFTHLGKEIEDLLGQKLPRENISLLEPPKDVGDDATKILVKDNQKQNQYVILISPEKYPDAVSNYVNQIDQAKEALGKTLSRNVLNYEKAGRVNNQSYVILPFYDSFRVSNRISWPFARKQLRPAIFNWLVNATNQTRTPPTESELQLSFIGNLSYIRDNHDIDDHIRETASNALKEIDNQTWQPHFCLAHNDLWVGNLLLTKCAFRLFKYMDLNNKIILIDWAGSRIKGYPIFDLIRISQSLDVVDWVIKGELKKHSEKLGCEPAQSAYYLLAAFGHIGLNLGEYPYIRYMDMVHHLSGTLNNALAASDSKILHSLSPFIQITKKIKNKLAS